MMVLPYLHTDGEMQRLEAELRATVPPGQVVARVSAAKGAAAGRGAGRRSRAFLFVLAVLVGAGLRSLPSSAPPAPPTPSPPPPLLLPLPGGAPNCFGNDAECARGLMLPLPLAPTPPSSSSSRAGAAAAAPAAQPSPPPSLLDLVPKVIHMTVEDRARVPCHMVGLMRSWGRRNPGWRVWVWDANDRDRLIAEAFPRWRPYFARLPGGVERADLFKYAVLSAIGGVYTDIDVECRRPIAEWPRVYERALRMQQGRQHESGADASAASSESSPSSSALPPKSALILGIEAMHDDAQTYVDAKHVYPLQLSAWTVLSSPGHPALGRTGDALFPASQAEAARELLALFAPPPGASGGAGAGSRLPLLRDVLGVGGGAGGGEGRAAAAAGGAGADFDGGADYDGPADDADLLDARARLWWRESILNRTGPFLLTRQVLAFAAERLEPSLRLGTHEDAARALRNREGYVGRTVRAPAAGAAAAAAAGSGVAGVARGKQRPSATTPSSPSSSPSSPAAVAILPLDAFGAGQPHSHAGPEDGEGVLAVHRFLSSWRGSGDGKGEGYWCEWTGAAGEEEGEEDFA